MKSEPVEPSLRQVFVDDLKRTRFGRDYLRELRQLYYFYLDDGRRAELATMGRIRRAFSLLAWISKSLMMKLSPARRLAVLVALLFTLFGHTELRSRLLDVEADFRPFGFLIVLVVLMLELRDKLLVRDEIEIARQVQLALLPRSHPTVPGWQVWSTSRPANDVGGDLVDYIDLDGFRQGVILGDVAGKGLGAALLTAKLQASLRALVPDAPGLEDLGQRVNTILHRDGLDNRYATLFFAVLEHHSGQVRYLNAGHNPPFVIRADRIDTLEASSFPLGMLERARYQEGQCELSEGDVLLAYSDGLTEALNDREEEFGVERLKALLGSVRGESPEVIGSRVLAAVDAFIGEVRPADDLSLVVIVHGGAQPAEG
jgi:hypothetical protein